MLYVVTSKYPKDKGMSLDQILFGGSNESSHRERTYPGTVTKCYKSMPDGLYTEDDIQRLINKLAQYVQVYGKINKRYHHFEIPKKSGGMRHICEPYESLKIAQIKLRELITNNIGPMYHTSAFAYCKGRSTLNCIKRHQANKSNWFLKLDFSNFFGNTNKKFVLSQLQKIVPFNLIMQSNTGKLVLERAIDICFLNDSLPQGTPISPMLTNIVMIPFDHELNKRLHKKGLVYTRYADDLQISGRYRFDVNEIIGIVKEVAKQVQAPYELNEDKTRFGSRNGKNWNLGLMLNKDNKITIGHKQHKFLKANIYNFLMDEKNNKKWPTEKVEVLAGQIAYFKSIEPQTVQYITTKVSNKVGLSFEQMLKKRMNSNKRRVYRMPTLPFTEPDFDFF